MSNWKLTLVVDDGWLQVIKDVSSGVEDGEMFEWLELEEA